MEFNNREIAILLWTAVIISLLVLKADVRKSAAAVVRAFFQRMIVLSLISAAIWTCLIIWVLFQCGLWQWVNFKTTLVWAVSFALVTMFDINRISESDTYFGQTLRDTINATVVVAFIAESYSFSLLIELILFPVLLLVAGMMVVAEGNPKHAQISKLCYAILIISGLTYFGYGLYQAAMNFSDFVTWSNFREFFVPILLSLLFLPFIYAFSVYVTYESNLLRLNWLMKDENLRRYAKYQAIFQFGFSLELLRRWARDITANQPSNKKDVLASIAETKSRRERERNPPQVPQNEGWCPYAAKDFAINIGLPTSDYHPTSDGQWFASSKLLELESDGIIPNNLAYYIEGNAHAAKRLKINLHINNSAVSATSERIFQNACEVLLHAALGGLPDNLHERIKKNDVIDEVIGGRHIYLTRKYFSGGISDGYLKTLTIDHEPAKG